MLLLCYSPAIGVMHSGDSRSLVFDLADTVKFSVVLPVVMKHVAEGGATDFIKRNQRDTT